MKNILIFLLFVLFIHCSTYEKEERPIYNKEEKPIITLASGAQVEKKGKHYVFQEDLILSDKQFQGLDQYGDVFAYRNQQVYKEKFHPEYGIVKSSLEAENEIKPGEALIPKAVALPPGTHWAMVRFTFDANLDALQIAAIQHAMDEMQALTNIRFYNATGEPTSNPNLGITYNYINFYSSDVNNSQLGSIGGKQTINLESFNSKTIIHEILHALGLFHEQSRPDRDVYVDVNYANISGNNALNFDRVTQNFITIGTFDFNSIMLYDSYAFSVNGQPTLTKKDGSIWHDNEQMSELDRSYVNSYYIPYKSNPTGTRVLIDDQVYKADNTRMTEVERNNLERRLNGEPPIWDGNGKPPLQ